MARVNKQILGLLKGSLSDVVFRERNGKIFAYSKPAKQKVSKSQPAVNVRRKFALTVFLAKIINSNKFLSSIWTLSNVKATNAYQKIIKANTSLTEANHLSLLNKITPDGFYFENFSINYDSNVINIKLDFNNANEELYNINRLFCLIHLWNDNEKLLSNNSTFLKLIECEILPIKENSVQTFIIKINELTEKLFDNCILYLSLAGDMRGNPIWSSTISRKIF